MNPTFLLKATATMKKSELPRPHSTQSFRTKYIPQIQYKINKLELIGFAGDPVFQQYKEISNEINSQNRHSLQIAIEE